MKRVVVLGGGIAGLTAAFRLAEKRGGEGIVVLESARRLGGAIQTLREDGYVAETGPNTLRTSEAAERLIADLNLEDEVVLADPRAPRWIVRGGRPRAVTPGPGALFTSALPLRGKLRALREPWVPGRDAGIEDESVHDFFARRLGEDVARYAAGPMVSGVYADDPKTLSTRSAFPALWEAEGRSGSVVRGFMAKAKEKRRANPRAQPFRPRTLNFTRGLTTLVEALESQLRAAGVVVATGDGAIALEPSTDVPWAIRTASGHAFEADLVISTVEAPSLAKLLGGRLPRSGDRLLSLQASPVAVVLLGFKLEKGAMGPRGFGALVPRGEGLASLGVLYPSSLFRGRSPNGQFLTTSFLGGALDPDRLSAPDESIVELAEREVRALHPTAGLGAVVFSRLIRWPRAIPRLPLGHHETLALLTADLNELNGARERPTLLVTSGFRDGIALGQRIEWAEAISAEAVAALG